MAQQRDDDVWRQSPIDRAAWKKNRFGACRAMAGNQTAPQVKSIPLCEPAPTPELQKLCKAMVQYRVDIASANCQVGGDCLYKPGAFYTPYAWSIPNQEYAADTILGYYKSIVKQPRFSSDWSALCPSRNALAASIAALSHAQAQICPANQIEFLKDVLKTMKVIGKDILEMGYCAVMFAANAVAGAFGSAASAEAMSIMSKTYLARFVDIAGRIIMPVLNAIITVLFGKSGLGQVISEALRLLCELYNMFIRVWLVPVWCGVLRPTLYVVIQGLSSVIAVFDRGVADKISEIWTALSGAGGGTDLKSCLGTSVTPQLSCPAFLDAGGGGVNASEFLPQPLATRCWANSGGGGFATSYLTCTSSDTCAVDSTHFDEQLRSCASCPDASFGCNTYLKRCTCGSTLASVPGKCTSSSDCAPSVCAVSSRLDNVADAFTHMPCNQCGGSGMHATCVEGTCACVDVTRAGTVQTCPVRGRPLSLISR